MNEKNLLIYEYEKYNIFGMVHHIMMYHFIYLVIR